MPGARAAPTIGTASRLLRSPMRPIPPTIDPDMAPTIAISGTLP